MQMTAAALLVVLVAGMNSQIDALQTLVIHEDVDRYASVGNKTQKIDTFETTAEVIDGVEQYSGTKHDGHDVSGAEISGTWSFGELATMLRTTRDALALPGLQVSPEHVVFHLPASSGRWFVRIDSRVYWLDITGEVSSSGIRWASSELPASTGVRHIVWTVAFRKAEVAGQTYLLPGIAEYRVIHCGKRSEWNVTRFAAVGRYGSELSINYAQ
jgi:hypothetical protein